MHYVGQRTHHDHLKRYGEPSDVLAMRPNRQQGLDPRILHNLGKTLLPDGHVLLREQRDSKVGDTESSD